jgi:anti-anti-sigma factor
MFSHQECNESGGRRLALSGELDLSVREEVRGILASPGNTSVDLRDLTFLDCSGIGELIHAYTNALRRGSRLTVSGAYGEVRWVLELTGVLALLAGNREAVGDRAA